MPKRRRCRAQRRLGEHRSGSGELVEHEGKAVLRRLPVPAIHPGCAKQSAGERRLDRGHGFGAAGLPARDQLWGGGQRGGARGGGKGRARGRGERAARCFILDDPRRQPALQHPHEAGKIDRLGQMRLHARKPRAGDIFGIGIGGQRDDRHQSRPDPFGTDRAGRGQPVAFGHLHIHQHQIIGPPAHHLIDHHRDRLVPVMRDIDFLPAAFEHFGHQQAVDVVIFDQQDARRIERCGERGRGRRGCEGRGKRRGAGCR